ncbi:ERF family protein [Agrococcus casei]|uniref:ERF family protein n=1 Tax=Agrococcus casei TaxID=343512 RepID=UPI003F8F3D84
MNTRTTKTAPSGKVEHANFAEAMAAFQAELPEVGKASEAAVEEQDGTVRTYRYAGLPDISAAVLPALGRHGLSFVTRPLARVDGFVLSYEMMHEKQGGVVGTFPLPDPMTTPADEFGYQVSRARRIALCAITGVAPGGSDEATRQATSEPQAAAAPTRDWIAEAGQFDDPEQIKSLWHELRDEVKAGRAKQATLDAVAELARQATPAADEPEPSS